MSEKEAATADLDIDLSGIPQLSADDKQAFLAGMLADLTRLTAQLREACAIDLAVGDAESAKQRKAAINKQMDRIAEIEKRLKLAKAAAKAT